MRIPVVHCFDKNYVVPAAVSFHSMLTHASREHDYALHVLHDDIPEDDQARLAQVVSAFPGATLEFVRMSDRFADLFARLATKAHYSKEIFYKFVIADLFPDDDKVIVTDVDVVFLGDVSREFVDFDTASDAYYAGCRVIVRKGSWVDRYQQSYAAAFSEQEMEALVTGAGYYLFNTRKMRQDRMSDRFIAYAEANVGRLKQPEQDTIGIVCHPHMKLLSPSSMVCTYCYEFYAEDADTEEDVHWSGEEVRAALAAPVQLHYATAVKPWTHPECTRADVWYAHLMRTPFAERHLKALGERLRLGRAKRVASFRLPFSRRKRVIVSIESTK